MIERTWRFAYLAGFLKYNQEVMSRTISFVKNHVLGVVLLVVCVYVCCANYTPNTFLTGWDTLHPEFNYRIYWSRILDGAWQEHQGLGAVATQAHASEIPRILVLMLLDLLLPMNMVRYAYAFLMLLLGPLGVYAFVKYGVLKDRDLWVGEVAGFAGGLFYLFNLGTLQHFYVPLEMFLTHFGLLGWFFLTVIWYLREGSKKSLTWFSVVTLFMTSQAHTATLFYALFLYLVVYLAVFVVAHRFSKQVLKRAVVVVTGTLVINLFWFLPNLYFAVNHGKEIQESKIHYLFSEEAFLQNKEFGNVKDTAILKSFLFNWGEYVGHGRFGDLLDGWKTHLQRPGVLPLGYAFFGLTMAGLIIAVIKKERVLLGVGLMMLVGIFFIFNVNPPLGDAFLWMQDNIPLFKEAFRFPFTKFSIGLVFCYAVFLAYFVAAPVNLVSQCCRKIKYPILAILSVILLTSFYYYAKPMFNGGLISSSMRVNIPQRYFDMFSYFDSQEQYGRVLNLPIHSFWGWVYHSWDPQTTLGYQGAGFLWFGIKQPLINREFDRWNLANEKPYMEISTAIYSEDTVALEKLLDKYKIRWLLVDQSTVAPEEDEKQLFYPQIESLLKSSQKIKLEKDFGQGLVIYKYYPDRDFALKDQLSTYYKVGDSTFKEPADPIYSTYGNYAEDGAKSYPFVGITNYDESVVKSYMSSDDKNIYFGSSLDSSKLSADFSGNLFQYKVSLERTGENYRLDFTPTERAFDLGFSFDLGKVEVGVSAISINDSVFSLDSSAVGKVALGTALLDPSEEVKVALLSESINLLTGADFFGTLESCSLVGEQTAYSLERTETGFSLSAQNVDACVTVDLQKYLGTTIGAGGVYELRVGGADELKKQEACAFDSVSGLCSNMPLLRGRAYFRTLAGRDYSLRFFARGKKSLTREVRVEYSNVGLFALKSETGFTFKPDLVLQKELALDKWRFEKDSNYSGNAAQLNNYPRLCNTGATAFNKSKISVMGSFGTPFVRYESHGEALCDSFEFPLFKHASGAVLEIRSRNLAGMPLRICLTNEYSKRCDLYVSLAESTNFTTQYFLVPPMGGNRGYTVSVSNLIFGTSVSINDLEYVALAPFPYNLVKSVHKPLEQGKNLLVYNQAFESGWVAWCGFKPCRAEHILVNNWANGWVFNGVTPSSQSVIIFFWPQILEYVGFVALLGWFVAVVKGRTTTSDNRAHSIDKSRGIGYN